MKTKENKVFKKIIKTIEIIAIIIMIFVSAVILTQRITNNQKSFLGFKMFRVQTGSMTPVYNVGDVLLVKEKPIEKIKIDDDLVYLGKEKEVAGKMITHRVIKVEKNEGKTYFHTKGIANKSVDPIVSEEQVHGTVVSKLRLITWICELLGNRYIFYFIFIVPITLYTFFAYVHSQERRYVKKMEETKKKEKVKIEKEEEKKKQKEEKKNKK